MHGRQRLAASLAFETVVVGGPSLDETEAAVRTHTDRVRRAVTSVTRGQRRRRPTPVPPACGAHHPLARSPARRANGPRRLV